MLFFEYSYFLLQMTNYFNLSVLAYRVVERTDTGTLSAAVTVPTTIFLRNIFFTSLNTTT